MEPAKEIEKADWLKYELGLRELYEKRSLENRKLATEFSKLVVSNLVLINAGALIALPPISAFIGIQNSISFSQKFYAVGIPAIFYVFGLLIGLLCALVTYFNFAYAHHAADASCLRELADTRKLYPWVVANPAYQKVMEEQSTAQSATYLDRDRKIGTTYWLGHFSGWISLACFLFGSTWLLIVAAK